MKKFRNFISIFLFCSVVVSPAFCDIVDDCAGVAANTNAMLQVLEIYGDALTPEAQLSIMHQISWNLGWMAGACL